MARSSRNDPKRSSPPKRGLDGFLLSRRMLYLALAAGSSALSQLNLAPVYGSIPSSLYHVPLISLSVVLAIAADYLNVLPSPSKLEACIPVLAVYIPTIQSVLFMQSTRFGPIAGPLLTEALTVSPLIFLSTLLVLKASPGPIEGQRIRTPLLGMGAFAFIQFSEKFFARLIRSILSIFPLVISHLLQVLLAMVYAALSPSRLLLLAIPSLLHSALFSVHMPLPRNVALLNQTLQSRSGYSILDRSESVTGYLSVIEGENRAYRALRCGHSLLGGEWLQEDDGEDPKIRDPIYAVFVMLEAVRLVQLKHAQDVGDSASEEAPKQQALIIGLGIGTSASAMIAHGVDTTFVEIDPKVHEYATAYFGLRSNHTPVIEDAVSYVERAGREGQRYDYIIHDVFTGGAEPVDLFTLEFIQGLYDLLKPDGTIAINYAGDLFLPSARLVFRTIASVFPNCRLFREDEDSRDAERERDFTNLVVFCVKADSAFYFRRPTEADFLGTVSRRVHLLPRHEVSSSHFRSKLAGEGILTRKSRETLERWHRISAVGHWRIMRTVIPDVVWENW